MSAGGSASDNFEPRAMVAMTAEYVPSVTSLRARLVLLGVGSDEVDVATLIRLGQHHEQYRLAMAAYVCWLRICSALKSQFIPRQRLFWTRQLGRDWTGHDRLPGNYAMLMTGITYLDFFLHHVFDGQVPDVAKDLQGRAAKVFLGLMKDQQRLLTEEDVPTRFMRLLRSAINQKRVHLALPDGGAPDCATAWGWRTTVKGFRARGTLIGWLAGREGTAYFDPGALFSAVRQEASRQGEPIALPRRAIFNQLREEGLLLEGNSGFTLRRTVEGRSQAVVWLDLERATERASGGVSD